MLRSRCSASVEAMTITWYGGRCVLAEEKVRGGEARSALFFPNTKTSRARTLESRANVIVAGTDGSRAPDGGQGFVITSPGEYDVAQILIRGMLLGSSVDAPSLFIVDGDTASFGIITGAAGDHLAEQELETIGTVDVLAVPVPFRAGAKDAEAAVEGIGEFIRAVEPHAVVVLLQDTKYQKAVAAELGSEGEKMGKFSVTRKDLPEEGFRLIFLEAQ